MRVAIPSTRPGLDGDIRMRLGENAYLLIIDTDGTLVEAVRNPVVVPEDFMGEISVILRLVTADVQTFLVDWCPPAVTHYLQRAGIQVLDGFQGATQSAIQQVRQFCTAETHTNLCGVLENQLETNCIH